MNISGVPSSDLWVLLPAYNEEKRIQTTLDALATQEDRAFTLCVIINASTDSTEEIVNRFARTSPFLTVVLCESTKGVGCAIDTGAQYAISGGARFIARTDADSIPHPDWTMEVRKALESGVEFACGVLLPRRDENGVLARVLFSGSVLLATMYSRLRPGVTTPGGHRSPLYAGFNMAVASELYIRCGGMPRTPSPTDRRFMNRVLKAGGRVQRVATMKVETSTRRFRALGIVGAAKWYLGRGATFEDPR